MSLRVVRSFAIVGPSMPPPSPDPAPSARREAFVREHFAYAWRVCRRLGLAPADADDAAQRALWTALERLDDIRPGSERAFLYRVVAHVVSKQRRAGARRREEIVAGFDQASDPGADPEATVAARRAIAVLDSILAELEPDLRAAFVLFEVEGLEKREVAEALGIPPGTAASRLRRAREEFLRRARRRGLHEAIGGAER
jgi:RNA polymerase sigma-70 factor (ECF subfamily)